MNNKKENFVKKSNKKHDNKYDYSKVEYVNSKTKVCIICPEHGEFWQTPAAHVRGNECPECANKKRGKRTINTESLIEKYQSIHNNKYTYGKTQYIDANTKICVTCPEHGDFYILPFNHLNGQGCPKCSVIKREQNKPMSSSFFIKRSSQLPPPKGRGLAIKPLGF